LQFHCELDTIAQHQSKAGHSETLPRRCAARVSSGRGQAEYEYHGAFIVSLLAEGEADVEMIIADHTGAVQQGVEQFPAAQSWVSAQLLTRYWMRAAIINAVNSDRYPRLISIAGWFCLSSGVVRD